MISLDNAYLKDLANNITLTERHSLEALDVLLLITEILELRHEHPATKPDQLAVDTRQESQGIEQQRPQPLG